MIRNLKPFSVFVLLALLFTSNLSFAQDDDVPYLEITGQVIDGRERLENAYVRVEKNGNFDREIRTDRRGKFDLKLDLFNEFNLYFGKEGYVTKRIHVDTRTIDEGQVKSAYLRYPGWKVEIFSDDLGVDISILEKPIGKVTYDPEYNSFVNDDFYTKTIQNKLDKLMDDLRRARDEKIMEQERLEEEYQLAVEDGEAFMEEGDLENALFQFRAAMKIKPEEKYPQKQIEKLNEQINNQRGLEERYNSLLTQADDFFYEDNWNEALDLYKEASTIKPDEFYPKDQIKTCEENIEAEKRRKRLREEYDKQIAKADQAYEGGAIAESKKLYESALNVLPDEEYPKEQIRSIESQLAAEAEKDKAYTVVMKEANSAFDNENFETARKKYTEALKIKPKEQEPKFQIAEIERILREREEAKKEAAQRQEELREEYDNVIAEADKYFDNDELDDAETEYKKATEILPEEEYPRSKLNEISQIRTNRRNAQKEYDNLMASGEQKFNNDELEEAKELFQKASNIKPEEKLPITRIQQIEVKLKQRAAREKEERLARQAEQRRIQAEYDSLITRADQYLEMTELDEAEPLYKKAKEVKPEENYPDKKIAEIKEERSRIQKREERYALLIQKGDKAFSAEQYQAAMNEYQAAILVKPEEPYPQDQVKKIKEVFAERDEAEREQIEAERREREKLNAEYLEIVEKADEMFGDSLFENSIEEYKNALKLKPEEQYPSQQITEAKKALEEIERRKKERARKEQLAAEKEERYKNLLSEGEANSAKEKYQNALSNFNEAIEVFPDREEAREKKKEVEALMAKAKEEGERQRREEAERERIEREYKTAMQLAAANFDKEKYDEAISRYREAAEIKPDEKEPRNKIAEIESLLARIEKEKEEEKRKEEERRELLSQYGDIIAEADSFYANENYNRARSRYEKAADIKPEESYPKERIKEIYTLQQAERERMAKFNSDLRSFNYELAENYPEGKTEEVTEEGNKKVTKIVIVRGDVGHEFLKEEYSWGDVFYSKNRRPYAKQNWEREIEEF